MVLGFQEVAAFMFAPRFPVLEPVEDVGITNLSILLKLGSDFPDFVSRWIHHSRIKNGFKDPDLFWFWVPSRLWFRASLFTSGSVW